LVSGEDVDKSYKDKGDDYKRLERDLDILQRMTGPNEGYDEKWKVKVPGGAKVFPSFPLAQQYKRRLKNMGIPCSYVTRIAQNSELAQDRVNVIAESLNKTFMVESINVVRGVKESGAAFCVFPNYFVTCAHVINRYDKYNIKANDDLASGVIVNLIRGGSKYRAIVVATDPYLDIALLKSDIKVEPMQLEVSFNIGDDIIAIGSPHGYENNVSTGAVGSVNRKIYFYNGAPNYTFVDLAIFPGNSGGPVIQESSGKVIGMVTLIVSGAGGYGLNASLPSAYIEGFCDENIEGFTVKKQTNKEL